MNAIKKTVCPQCQSAFECGAVSAEDTCWYQNFAPIFPVAEELDCLCPDCFKEAFDEKIKLRKYPLVPKTTVNKQP
jgi:hypothetical protein